MKSYVTRAIMIASMDEDTVQRLHDREKACGYLIPNWNIQELFNLSTLRNKLNLPVDNELLAQHNLRLESELKSKGFLKTGEYKEESLDWYHAFDANIQLRGGEIIWEYAGPRKDRRNLVKAIESSQIDS